MMTYRDYHIHLHHSPCASSEMTVSAIIDRAKSQGLDEIGLVNHLHPKTNPAVFQAARREIDSTISRSAPKIWLGAEAEILDQTGRTTVPGEPDPGIDYLLLAMGHFHLPWVDVDLNQSPDAFMAKECESLLIALEGNRVDVVAHPFIYATMHMLAPWLIGKIHPDRLPPDLIEELAGKLREKGVALELHCRDVFIRPQNLGGEPFVRSHRALMDYFLKSGVRFVTGSDAHYLDQIGRSRLAPDVYQQQLDISGKEAL